MYPIWPARVEPEKNASNAVSDPIEITPNAAEVRNTTRDALFGVWVRGETRESQSEKGSARSRAYAKKMREAATNCGRRKRDRVGELGWRNTTRACSQRQHHRPSGRTR